MPLGDKTFTIILKQHSQRQRTGTKAAEGIIRPKEQTISTLLALAVLPPLYLIYRVYKLDSIEKEPGSLLFRLFIFGILALIPAMILELTADGFIVRGVLSGMDPLFVSAIENFLCVALVEEGCKYFFLKKGTWNHPAFDYCFDAIVYAVVVSLGFAAVENIMYVFEHGVSVGLMRAVTSIPGHTIFGIFMGHYYGMAKMYANRVNWPAAESMLRKAIILPVFLHGFYDFTASQANVIMTIVFYAFIIILDVIAIRRIRDYARQDMPL